jgi:hypothetical protein
MQKIKQSLNLILGFILLGLLAWAAIWFTMQIGHWYGGLSDPIKTAVLAGIPVISVAVVGFYANKSIETKRAVEQAMRPKKLELYTEFNRFFMSIFDNEKVAEKPTEDDIMRFFSDKTPELITFASNEVIEKWGKLRVGLETTTANEAKMFLVEEMLKAIRTDLGHGKRGFHKGDILRLFVNDIDNFLGKKSKELSQPKSQS